MIILFAYWRTVLRSKHLKRQGYTDEELEIFRANPSYVKVVEGAPKFLTHRIIIEVVEAHHNCSAGHKAGDRVAVISGDGDLLTRMMPVVTVPIRRKI